MPQLLQNTVFIKAVAEYFMDFLETDFHKRRNPRRSIKLRNNDNLIVGIRLDKYPNFYSQVWKQIGKNLPDSTVNIAKGVYRADAPKNLLDLVALQIEKIPESTVQEARDEVENAIENYAHAHKDEYTIALDKTLDAAAVTIQDHLVNPFIASIEKSLMSLDIADENSTFMMAEELTDVLVKMLETKIELLLTEIIAGEKPKLDNELIEDFSLDKVKAEVSTFFDQLKTNDLFLELFEIDRNKNILDKQEFYLYFGDITYEKAKYPIFYLPLTVSAPNDTVTIQLDSQVYINKKSLEYIAQEYNAKTGKKGTLQTITERIIYLSQHAEDFSQLVQNTIDEITNFFELEGRIDITNTDHQIAKSALVRATNDLHIVIFDKSDEALINDYEELMMLDDDSELALELSELVQDFITKNPESVGLEVDETWNDLDVSDRLVSPNPIPLNSEQRKILMALNKENCRYVTVEGPPGTGKSHTITAIVFNAILENKSVLVLSDKKEALDVVEDKITQTMDAVRFDSEFQNPILRLGKTGNTYRQILQPSSINRIKTSYLIMRKEAADLDANIDKAVSSLKEDIDADKLFAKNINLEEVMEFEVLDHELKATDIKLDLDELGDDDNSFIELEELRDILGMASELVLGNHPGSPDLIAAKLSPKPSISFSTLQTYIAFIAQVYASISKVYEAVGDENIDASFRAFPGFADADLPKLEEYIVRIQQLKKPIVGFGLNKGKVQALDFEFQSIFPAFGEAPHASLDRMIAICNVFRTIQQLGSGEEEVVRHKLDFLKIISIYSSLSKLESLSTIAALDKKMEYAAGILEKYPKSAQSAGLNVLSFPVVGNYIVTIGQFEFDKILRYLNLKQKTEAAFASMPIYDYMQQKKNIEQMVTSKMVYLMDERLVDFAMNSASDAQVLKNIIKSKEKFPREQFEKLKSAFPCILAGVRDYAEYIPLDAGIFDLVIIDEASQVSIAQAFPALLRAKKVLILGDRLQFGNVKALQAKSDINTEYVNNLHRTFTEHVSSDAASLTKLKYFNVKRSVLDFFGFISNYQTMLVKHFRGYKENISFSNKYFYQGNLQVMKIRGKKIDEVIMFQTVEHDGKTEVKANSLEVEHIMQELAKMKNEGSRQTVGIITPHTNQQKKMSDAVSKDPNRDYYLNDLHLKVMTFDTCQGEERDIIYYSMVATTETDSLMGVFSKDLSLRSDEDEEESLRKQRLNVALSRSKESMRFVLSKPIEEFRGSIREALLHYQHVLEDAKKEKDVSTVDAKSGMEPKILNWFYQTSFWEKNKDRIEVDPQFEIGAYLKQLDPTYKHPAYKVDFLISYSDERGKSHSIIIEYDGFHEHQLERPDYDNTDNYESYYSAEDIYRMKVLESYGYKFIRINKFNLGSNPIATMDERISALLTGRKPSTYLSQLNDKARSLHNGDAKECPSCHEILPVEQYNDPNLASGVGRICINCKHANTKDPSANYHRLKPCPLCNAKMKLRTGYRGQFYGCTRFPACRGTRPKGDVISPSGVSA